MTNRAPLQEVKAEYPAPANAAPYNSKEDAVLPEGLDKTDPPIDDISFGLSVLELEKSKEAVDIPASGSKDKPVKDEPASSLDSHKTLAAGHPVVKLNEEEICLKLFSPLDAVPARRKLQSVLTEHPAVKIPIHQHTFNWLQGHVKENTLKNVFDIVEEVGNICPRLTPRVEAALHVNVPENVTEGMYQCIIDAFLMGVIGTAQEYVPIPVKLNRNAKDPSMTRGTSRPNFFMMFDDQLVFKGEEKKDGYVRQNVKQLTQKMKPGSVGKNGKLRYIIGYATAGSRILFECIYGDNLMSECSKILDLEYIADRVTLILILVNVMRVSRALYKSMFDDYLFALLFV
ncbi:hypothetical protein EV183_001198 [Coemansia sp. RSA 2336]|nr:hypothetical protein EV183_001198 [Coemansia sp. RSA 2336]